MSSSLPPITLPPINRRRFLAGSLAAGAGLLTIGKLSAADATVDPNRYLLMTDTHVHTDPAKLGGKEQTNMFQNLLSVATQTAALTPRPTAVIMHGDEGFLYGMPAEYVTLAKGLVPITEAGIPVHMAMGNHDRRSGLWKQFPPKYGEDKHVPGRHISIIEGERVNWFIADTLGVINAGGGMLGEEQIKYLLDQIDARPDKPAIISSHHQPWKAEWSDIAAGIKEGEQFTKEIVKRRQVKAWFHGHLHLWRVDKLDDLHVIGLPTLGWVFAEDQTQAYVIADLAKDGMKLQIKCLKMDHPFHDNTVALKWRKS